MTAGHPNAAVTASWGRVLPPAVMTVAPVRETLEQVACLIAVDAAWTQAEELVR